MTVVLENAAGFLREKIFSTKDIERPGADLSDVDQFGVESSHISQEWIQTSDGGKIGAWYMEPQGAKGVKLNKAILQLHGVKGTRARKYRVDLYNVLLKMGFSILAFDYRGFGDSTEISPTESSMVSDSVDAYDWLRKKVGAVTEIVVFGHSMGCAVSTHTVSQLIKRGETIKHVILMAPFNNFYDVVLATLSEYKFLVVTSSLTRGYFLKNKLKYLDTEFR